MPVEIKELHIKATVGGSASSNGMAHKRLSEEEREQLIQECLERMQKILKMKNHR